jgi:hypothetical protein
MSERQERYTLESGRRLRKLQQWHRIEGRQLQERLLAGYMDDLAEKHRAAENDDYERGVRDAVQIVQECWQRGGASYLSYCAREILARLLPGARP